MSSPTTVTAECDTSLDHLTITLHDLGDQKDVLIAPKINQRQICFDAESGVLPGKKYKLQVTKRFETDCRDEHGNQRTEDYEISTPGNILFCSRK